MCRDCVRGPGTKLTFLPDSGDPGVTIEPLDTGPSLQAFQDYVDGVEARLAAGLRAVFDEVLAR